MRSCRTIRLAAALVSEISSGEVVRIAELRETLIALGCGTKKAARFARYAVEDAVSRGAIRDHGDWTFIKSAALATGAVAASSNAAREAKGAGQ